MPHMYVGRGNSIADIIFGNFYGTIVDFAIGFAMLYHTLKFRKEKKL